MVQFREERSHTGAVLMSTEKTVFEAPIPLSSRRKEDEGESYDIVVGERKGVDKATQRNFWTCDEPSVVSSKVIRDPVAPRRTVGHKWFSCTFPANCQTLPKKSGII